MAAPASAAVSPFPPPPRFYEDFEPHSNTEWKCPEPPKPLEGPYIVFGTMYDTTFAPQHPATALEPHGLAVKDSKSPVATLRQLNRALPDEYLNLIELMINRPVLCTSEQEKERTEAIDEQRGRIERLIAGMYLSLARFRPFQARQALITTLRAQVERRKAEAAALKDCRQRAQTLISAATTKLSAARTALQTEAAAAAEKDKEHPLDAAASKVSEQEKDKAAAAVPDPDEKPTEEEQRAAKKRKTASLISKLESLAKPNAAPPPPE
mmetsp:Transcript_27848/g.65686  ORF Transcript_27848/g.65686 Transcript_27848/m.65686 type:complete len:267 (-) Transcript_27848:133-933(-)